MWIVDRPLSRQLPISCYWSYVTRADWPYLEGITRRGKQHRSTVSIPSANANMVLRLCGNNSQIFLTFFQLLQLLTLKFSVFMLASHPPYKIFQTLIPRYLEWKKSLTKARSPIWCGRTQRWMYRGFVSVNAVLVTCLVRILWQSFCTQTPAPAFTGRTNFVKKATKFCLEEN